MRNNQSISIQAPRDEDDNNRRHTIIGISKEWLDGIEE